MKKDKTVVCFDFDGVIATYDGYKGKDIFGEPVEESIKAINILKGKGYAITIWTTRESSPALVKWLADNGVQYDTINESYKKMPNTSSKPLFDCFVDDRALNFNYAKNRLSTEELVRGVENRIAEHKS